MVQVLLSFDTEDYTSSYSDDAILRLSEIMKEEGVRGCFNIVAELAKALIDRKRYDIVESLKSHEINYHSYRHTWHPTMVEYTDIENWDEGYTKLFNDESKGISIVKDIFNRDKLWAFVPPGNCISPQAIYGFSEMGVKICNGSLFKGTSGRGIWFCNSFNLENNFYIDSALLNEGISAVKNRIEEWVNWKRLIICCHPNIIVHEEFWDAVNMKGRNLVEWGNWKIPGLRRHDVIEKFYADFREMIRILKKDGNFRFVTNSDVWAEQTAKKPRTISFNMLLDFLNRLEDSFFYIEQDSVSYSLADIFMAAVHFISGSMNDYQTREVTGPVYYPAGITDNIVVSAGDLKWAALYLLDSNRIPHEIQAGQYTIGPRDFLEAAKKVFQGEKTVAIGPKPQLADTGSFYKMNDFHLAGTWMYPNDFKDEWVSRRLKWQSWTIRSEC